MIDQETKFNKFFLENDWHVSYMPDGGIEAVKAIKFPHLAGEISRDGTRIVKIEIDGGWRYPEIKDGWGKVIASVDLREYQDVGIVIETLLKKGY